MNVSMYMGNCEYISIPSIFVCFPNLFMSVNFFSNSKKSASHYLEYILLMCSVPLSIIS